MVRPLSRMAPVLRAEDLKTDYVYGLDAESIRKEFLTHLEFTLAELPDHVDTEWEPSASPPAARAAAPAAPVAGFQRAATGSGATK